MLLKSVKLSVQDEKLRSPPRSNAVVYFILFISFGYLESEFNVNTKSLYDCLADYVDNRNYIKFIYGEEENNEVEY